MPTWRNSYMADNGQTLEQQIVEQKKAEFQASLASFVQEFDALQRKHGIVLVPCIRHGNFGAIVPDFEYVSKDDFERLTGQTLTPQETPHASNL